VKTTWAARYRKVGNSWAVDLPKEVRERLQLRPGDLLLMTLYGDLFMMCRVEPRMVVEKDPIPVAAILGPRPEVPTRG